jgi:hypothetical protein
MDTTLPSRALKERRTWIHRFKWHLIIWITKAGEYHCVPCIICSIGHKTLNWTSGKCVLMKSLWTYKLSKCWEMGNWNTSEPQISRRGRPQNPVAQQHMNLPLRRDKCEAVHRTRWFTQTLRRGARIPGAGSTRRQNFLVASNICGYSLQILLNTILLAPTLLRRSQIFRKFLDPWSGALIISDFYLRRYYV